MQQYPDSVGIQASKEGKRASSPNAKRKSPKSSPLTCFNVDEIGRYDIVLSLTDMSISDVIREILVIL